MTTAHPLPAPDSAPGSRRTRGSLPVSIVALTLAAGLPSTTGCNFAVNHPAVTAGLIGGTLGLATCKLASDNVGACFAVGGGAGSFLALVTATALWLGGDGHTVMVEEQAQPLPEDSRPRRRRVKPPVAPTTPEPAPAPGSPTPAPGSPTPAPDLAPPAPSSPANPAPTNPGPASPPATSPAPVAPPPAGSPPASPAPAGPASPTPNPAGAAD